MTRRGWTAALLFCGAGCLGPAQTTGSDPMPGTPTTPAAAALFDPSAFGEVGLRRQTRPEIAASLIEIFGVDPSDLMALLPPDVAGPETVNPFDNDFTLQDVSTAWIGSMNEFAETYSSRVASSPARLQTIAACTPTGPGDMGCFAQMTRAAGRLAFRRPLTSDEATGLDALFAYATEENDFGSAIDALVQALVQHPSFLYRIEIGTPTATTDLLALDDYAIASRMAFLLWGQIPDAALLDAADAGLLKDASGRHDQAVRMLADPRARQQWQRFHAEWLGYANVALPAGLDADMRQETAALLDRLNFDQKGSWLDVFRVEDTYVTPALAQHYGLPAPTAPAWVPYDAKRGGGILSHGDFLLQGSKFGDTSPTLRGYRMLKRVLCEQLGPIPPGIDTDTPPAGTSATSCKPDRYFMRQNAACASCHTRTDDLGFGLENLGPSGEWRDTEPGLPSCSIDGQGEVHGQAFSGPRELGEIFGANEDVGRCADRQLLRFVLGRADAPTDAATLGALEGQRQATNDLTSILMAFVETPAIAYRKQGSQP